MQAGTKESPQNFKQCLVGIRMREDGRMLEPKGSTKNQPAQSVQSIVQPLGKYVQKSLPSKLDAD